jgi:hypothetical protein
MPANPSCVSAIVPNYNHARFLRRRLESVLGQTFGDFELIVLDDASTDDSREVIAPFLRDARVRFHPSDRNSGSPFVQWNRGVQLARGEFVWLAESDDFAAPQLLETLVGLLRANPRAAIAYCQSLRVDADDQVLGSLADYTADLDATRWQRPFVNDGRDECGRFLLWKNTIPNASAVVFRREAYLRAGGAPLDLRLSGDWLAWARLLLQGDIAFTPEPLNYFRQHPSTVRAATSLRQLQEESWRVQRFILRHGRAPAGAREQLALKVYYGLLDRFDHSPRDTRWRELSRGLAAGGPLLAGAPLKIGRELLRKIRASTRTAAAN